MALLEAAMQARLLLLMGVVEMGNDDQTEIGERRLVALNLKC